MRIDSIKLTNFRGALDFTQAYLTRDADNRLVEFCSTVAHLFGHVEQGVNGA